MTFSPGNLISRNVPFNFRQKQAFGLVQGGLADLRSRDKSKEKGNYIKDIITYAKKKINPKPKSRFPCSGILKNQI